MEKTLLDAFGLIKEVKKLDSLRSRDILIISYVVSISSLCLVCADAMVVAMAKIIVLEIEYCIIGSIRGSNILEVDSWN